MTRAGVMSVVTKRVFIGMMLWAWAPFVVRAVQIYVSQLPQASFLAPRARPSASSSISRAVRLLRHHLRRRRPDRQRSPRQRLQLYLSKPMTSAEYIAGKLAILCIFLTGVTFLPAMMLLLTQAVWRAT
jgi:hypothetical protein